MDKNNKKIIIHVGIHKTGSTFLQNEIFLQIKNVHSVCCRESGKIKNIHKTFALLYEEFSPPEVFDYKEHRLEKLKTAVWEYINTRQENTILISEESFSGIHRFSPKRHSSFSFNELSTRKLKFIFPNAKIFMVFRRQDDWIYSLYNHIILRRNLPLKLIDFIKNENYFDENSLNWTNIIKNYQNTYGEDNILAIPYEMLKKDSEAFLRKFYTFFELEPYYPENYIYLNERAPSEKQIKASRFFSKYLIFLQNLPKSVYYTLDKINRYTKIHQLIKLADKIFSKNKFNFEKEVLGKHLRKKILTIYTQSNKNLSELTGINLSEYKYY